MSRLIIAFPQRKDALPHRHHRRFPGEPGLGEEIHALREEIHGFTENN